MTVVETLEELIKISQKKIEMYQEDLKDMTEASLETMGYINQESKNIENYLDAIIKLKGE